MPPPGSRAPPLLVLLGGPASSPPRGHGRSACRGRGRRRTIGLLFFSALLLLLPPISIHLCSIRASSSGSRLFAPSVPTTTILGYGGQDAVRVHQESMGGVLVLVGLTAPSSWSTPFQCGPLRRLLPCANTPPPGPTGRLRRPNPSVAHRLPATQDRVPNLLAEPCRPPPGGETDYPPLSLSAPLS